MGLSRPDRFLAGGPSRVIAQSDGQRSGQRCRNVSATFLECCAPSLEALSMIATTSGESRCCATSLL